MADRPLIVEGANPVLVALVVVLALVAALIWFGPGLSALREARADLTDKQERLAEWNRAHEAAAVITQTEKARWTSLYARYQGFGTVAKDEPALLASVARQLEAPSVRGLEVAAIRDVSDGDESRVVHLSAPFDESGVEVRQTTVRARFEADYDDIRQILARLDPRIGGVAIRRLELQRHFPAIRVDLELAVFTRRDIQS